MRGKSAVGFGEGTSINDSVIDHRSFSFEMLDPTDSRDVRSGSLSSEDGPLPSVDGPSRDGGSFNIWNPESSKEEVKQGPFDDAPTFLSLGSPDVDTDNRHTTSGQLHDTPQNTGPDIDISGNDWQVSGASSCIAFGPCLTNTDQIRSGIGSTSSFSPYSGGRYFPKNRDRLLQSSADSRLLGKRKIIEGASAWPRISRTVDFLHKDEKNKQVISSGSSENSNIHMSNYFDNLDSVNPMPDSSASPSNNAENTPRNTRRRLEPRPELNLPPPNVWSFENFGGHDGACTLNQQCFLTPHIPALQVEPAMPYPISQAQSTIPTNPVLPQTRPTFSWSTFYPLDNNSSSYPDRCMTNTHVRETDTVNLAEDPLNWNLTSGSLGTATSAASTAEHGSTSNPSQTWSSLPNFSALDPLRLFASQSFSSVVPGAGVQDNNAHMQHPDHPSSRGITHGRGTEHHSEQHHRRAALLMNRHNTSTTRIPSSHRMTTFRQGRSRSLSELRSALSVFNQGESVRIETLIGGVNFHDRHRDLRLDVDNMSYEELLALEERIGYVNTGLTEEVVMKQLRYSSSTGEESENMEPCCICQEDYVKDEVLGTVDCGHNFHAQCIKQWLSYKNLCPICKTTALDTGKSE